MGSVATQTETNYNGYFVPEEDCKLLPPYFQNVAETPQEVKCRTDGTWPEWLYGSFIRVGGGQWVVPLSEDGSKPNAVLQHFFDGLGMLHKFRMVGGEVFYTSRYTADGVRKNALKNGYLSTGMFGYNANTPLKLAQDPCSALLGAQSSFFNMTEHMAPDEVNINVVPRRGIHIAPDNNPNSRGTPAKNPETEEILVTTDFNMFQVCDAKSLEPKRLLTYASIHPELDGVGVCAHPPKDRKRGWSFNYIIDPKTGVMSIFALDYKSNPASLLWKTPLPCPPCYIHSMAMTQRFVVFIRNPFHMDPSDPTKSLADCVIYEPGAPVQFFVLDKETGKLVAQFNGPHFMFFHSVNAYDYVDPKTNQTNIHVDLCSYVGGSIPYKEYCFSNILDPAGPFQDGVLARYELAGVENIKPGSVGRVTSAASIPGVAMELPRIAKSASMVPGYRYVYATAGNGGPSPGTAVPIGRLGDGVKVPQAAFLGSLAKTDWETGTFKRWQPAKGESCPCEPVFVQRPDATEEDDGVVLTIVIDKYGTKSVLVALDGRTFEEVARADLPQVFGLAPHGSFIEGAFGE